MLKSLMARGDALHDPEAQLALLNISEKPGMENRPATFQEVLASSGQFPLKPRSVDVFQLNLGKMCNQTCAHCHVDAGPDRKEIMTRETMDDILAAIDRSHAGTVDLTGGAPEMNPNFRYLVDRLSERNKKIIVRCNLTIILANKKYHDLPVYFRQNQIEVVSSLPFYTMGKTDAQRGEGVFSTSIEALKMLNAEGYGRAGEPLKLNLVYNPSGAFLPGDQVALEKQFREKLFTAHGITFNSLYTITNLPISRFLDYLLASGNLDAYMNKLREAYNPLAVQGLMCRGMISVSHDGKMYDCDFNQMLDLGIGPDREYAHIRDFDEVALLDRDIVLNQHCFGCTAGAGSSCGGSTV